MENVLDDGSPGTQYIANIDSPSCEYSVAFSLSFFNPASQVSHKMARMLDVYHSMHSRPQTSFYVLQLTHTPKRSNTSICTFGHGLFFHPILHDAYVCSTWRSDVSREFVELPHVGSSASSETLKQRSHRRSLL
jgi:hypothetical protein